MGRRTLSRRAFLGGAGAALTLPWLEAMVPSVARGAGHLAPTRLLYYYIPNGIHMPAWTPTTEGLVYDLPTILAPLAGMQSELSVITGLANHPGKPDGPGDHAGGTSAFLTCAHAKKTEGKDIQLGISCDQVVANAIGSKTAFPSLQLGTDGGSNVGGCDSGYSCAYSRNISWSGPASPLPKTVNPQLVFDRLFAGYDAEATEEEIARRKLYRTSILDYVMEDAEALQKKLGKTDASKMEEYLEGVRELEQRIEDGTDFTCEPGARPEGPWSFPERVDVLTDLMVLAFQCDQARVISFMMGNAGSNRSFGFLGVSGAHHEISHHQGLQENFDKLTTIATWEVAQFASLLERMQAVAEGDGSLLDNSLVFFSSEVEDGNAHRHTNLPVVLAGRGGGAVIPAGHLVLPSERPIADLFLTMMHAAGVPEETFANSTGPLDLG